MRTTRDAFWLNVLFIVLFMTAMFAMFFYGQTKYDSFDPFPAETQQEETP